MDWKIRKSAAFSLKASRTISIPCVLVCLLNKIGVASTKQRMNSCVLCTADTIFVAAKVLQPANPTKHLKHL